MSDYLTHANSFDNAIDRGAGHFRSGELDEAVKAIRRYIKEPNAGMYDAVTSGKRGVCTTFGQAAAHVLTKGIAHGPRVEVVSWGNSSTGHVFVLVNRKGGYTGTNVPDTWVTEKDVVIVDPWRGSLGWPTISFGKAQYRSGMVTGLMCVGEKPAW